jgi:hypothetical protein
MTGPDPRKVHKTREVLRKHRAPRKTTSSTGGREVRTQGLSRKLTATLIGAVGTQVIAFVVNLLASGEFNRTELAQIVGIGLTAAFGTVAGYLSQPDKQVRKGPER